MLTFHIAHPLFDDLSSLYRLSPVMSSSSGFTYSTSIENRDNMGSGRSQQGTYNPPCGSSSSTLPPAPQPSALGFPIPPQGAYHSDSMHSGNSGTDGDSLRGARRPEHHYQGEVRPPESSRSAHGPVSSGVESFHGARRPEHNYQADIRLPGAGDEGPSSPVPSASSIEPPSTHISPHFVDALATALGFGENESDLRGQLHCFTDVSNFSIVKMNLF